MQEDLEERDEEIKNEPNVDHLYVAGSRQLVAHTEKKQQESKLFESDVFDSVGEILKQSRQENGEFYNHTNLKLVMHLLF